MDEPRVTCNVDKWLQYIAHLIKNTGEVHQKDDITITDGAESNIRALKVGCTTTQNTTKGYNLLRITKNGASTDKISGKMWAETISDTANTLKMLKPATTYTFSGHAKMLERTSVPTEYDMKIAIRL